MAVHKVTKGLDIPISGVPEQNITTTPPVSRVAILARDFNSVKVRVLVEPGDQVRLGQPLLEHRVYPAIRFVSPGSGRVEAVHRGEKRALQSIVIALDTGDESSVEFAEYASGVGENREGARALLLESGLWTVVKIPDMNMSINYFLHSRVKNFCNYFSMNIFSS